MINVNLILDIKDVTEESGQPEEPVSLQEMKDYLRLEGWEGEDESGSDFEFDDDLLETMITAARKKAERYCGISIVSHSWQVLLTNCAGDIDLPYGPVQELTSIVDKNSNDLTDSTTLRGLDFKFLECPRLDLMTLQYDAGYEDVPEEIKLGIMQMVWFWYNNRGSLDPTSFASSTASFTIPEIALATLRPYKRAWTWLA